MRLRIFTSLILLFAVLYLPFWFYLLIAFGGMVYFVVFFEALVFMLLADLLYGVQIAHFHGIFLISFILATIFLITIEFVKKKTNFKFGQNK